MQTHFNIYNHTDRDFISQIEQLGFVAAVKPHATALITVSRDGDVQQYSYQYIERAVRRVAGWLRRSGLLGQVGDESYGIVGFPNCMHHVIAALSLWAVGLRYLPVSSKTQEEALSELKRELRGAVIFSDADVECAISREALDAVIADEGIEPIPPREASTMNFEAFLSGGSTGKPKIIQRNSPKGFDDEGLARWFDMTGQDFDQMQLVVGPIFHGAPNNFLFSGLFCGNAIVLPERFNHDLILEYIERYGVEYVQMVPTIMHRLLKSQRFSPGKISSLKNLLHTGGFCPCDLKEAWIGLLGAEHVYEIYSCTEGYGMAVIRGDEWLGHPGSVGKPYHCKAMICDAQGREVPPLEIGEIYMLPKSGFIPSSYLNSPPLQRNEAGYYGVGDMGFLDQDGYLYYVDRRDDVVVTGAENVYVGDVERALLSHESVFDAVVFGIPDPELGRSVVAMVVTSSPVGEAELKDHLSQLLLPFQIPKMIVMTEEIPRLENQKVNRKKLAEWYESGFAETAESRFSRALRPLGSVC